ncbi:unnamed protein product [Caenorhabditis angaria]|uniref:Serpentine receptor class r-10 n=1 Tax=Caenorhabditis angaria TaxID=860376 RepID=A0A9P1IVM9_9PELO|nr:unnamed protein product [Caenorhabditis angaria]
MNVLNGVYCGLFGISLGLFSIQFYYRYLVSIGSPRLKTFRNWNICLWMLIPFADGVIWFLTTYFLDAPSDSKNNHIKEYLERTIEIKIENIVYLGSYFYPIDEKTGKNCIDSKSAFAVIIMNSTLLISFSIIIYFGIKCYRSLRNNMRKMTSQKYKGIQVQLFYALVCQTTIPVLLLHLPVVTTFLCIVFDKDIGLMSGIHRTQIITSIYAVIINLILIILILTKSAKSLGAYKYLLLYSATFEIVYAVTTFFVEPSFFCYGSAFMLFIDTRTSLFTPMIMNILNGAYCGLFGVSLGLFSLLFYYRYLVSAVSPLVATFRTWKIYLWMLIPFLDGVIWFLTSYFLAYPSSLKDNHIKRYLEIHFGVRIEDVVYLGSYFYPVDEKTGRNFIDPKSVLVFVIMNSTLVVSLSIIIYFGTKCYKNLRSDMRRTKSRKFKGIQAQLFLALVFQTIIPVVLLHIPALTNFICIISDQDIGFINGIVTISIALYPVVDPIPNFFFIKNFRNTIFKFITGCCFTKLQRNIRSAIQIINS